MRIIPPGRAGSFRLAAQTDSAENCALDRSLSCR